MRTLARCLTVAVTCLPVMLAPPASAAPHEAESEKKTYVSLGDSYSVGQFLPVLVTTENYCGQSTSSYPRQMARTPRFADVYAHVRDVTCGGATIDNEFGGILRPQIGFGGPPVPVPEDVPPVPAQIDALNADTDLATVGIGGNTYLISEVGMECVRRGLKTGGTGTPCTDYYRTPFGLIDLDRRTRRLREQLDRMLPLLHAKAPNATFVFVGYPTVFPDNGSQCRYGDLTQGATVAPGDMAFLSNQMDHVNQLIRTAVERHGDTFVDTATPSRGHDFCQTGDDKWMFGFLGNGVGAGGKPFRVTVFHPNSAGAANQTKAVIEAVEKLGLLD